MHVFPGTLKERVTDIAELLLLVHIYIISTVHSYIRQFQFEEKKEVVIGQIYRFNLINLI